MFLKTEIRRRFFVPAIFLLISGSFALAWAVGEESASPQTSIRQEVEQKFLDDALGAFNAGDYGSAKNLFGMLSESAQTPEISRQALFGLASAEFILAHTTEEFRDALSSWKKWSGQSRSGPGCEDPRLLTPFLLRLEPAIKDAIAARSHGGRAAKETEAREMLKEKEMQSLRSKLEIRDREIRRLRHQLESLEEIHRKYQEKKQEASPATPAPPK
jgi:hypothetical protein